MRLVKLMLIFFLLVLTLAILVNAVEVTDSPFSEFQLTFSQFDTPVKIVSAKILSDQQNVDMNYIGDGRVFNFSSNVYLVNGFYTILIQSEDKDKNLQTYTRDIEIDADIMDIWVENPYHISYKDTKQDIAIKKAVPFDAVFKTEYDSVCRIKKNIGSLPSNRSELFENFMLTSFNEGDTSPTKTHNLHVASQGVPHNYPDHSYITVSDSFSNNNYVLRDSFLVVCKREIIGEGFDYPFKIFYISYDPSQSSFTGSFNPKTITDTSSIKTTFHLESSEDLMACYYAFIENPIPKQSKSSGSLFNFNESLNNYDEKISSITYFSTSYDKEFNFQEQLQQFPIGEKIDYKINLTCFNLAMEQKSQVYDFSIELTTAFDIILDRTHYSEMKPNLEFSTSLLSKCYYEFEYKDNFYSEVISDEPQTKHIIELPVSLDGDGDYNINLICAADTQEQRAFTFTIDTIPPADPVISSRNYYCGETSALKIKEAINDTVSYNISLFNGSTTSGQVIIDNYQTIFTSDNFTFALPSGINLEDQKQYTWEVIALDKAEQTSSPITHTITVKNSSEIECDATPPIGTALISKTDLGFSIDISCEDSNSGCSNNFLYAIQPLGTGCSGAIMSSGTYGSPLTSMTDGTLCYSVSDMAGNSANYSKQLGASISAEIDLLKPKFGIGNKKDFVFEIETSKPVTCKHGPYVENTNLAETYISLKQFGFTGGSKHTDTIISSDYSQFDTTKPEQESPWIVICKDGNEYYDLSLNEFGYDITDPVISLSITPETVTEVLSQKTIISVSADDEVVCTYLNQENVPEAFNNYDPNNRQSYISSHEKEYVYFGLNNKDLSQLISCRNVAQSVGETTKEIHINPKNDLGISVLSNSYSRLKSTLLEIQTNSDANCEYALGKEERFSLFQSTGETNHKKQLDLDEGETIINIKCEKGNQISQYYETIIVDTINPSLSIMSPDITCSLNEIKAILFADGTGSPINKYTYSLNDKKGNSLISGDSSKNELKIQYSLSEGKEYILSVSAYDKAGNYISSEKTFIAGNSNCDSNSPSAEIKFKSAWGKTETEIICSDNTDDCANKFTYSTSSEDYCSEIGEGFSYGEELYFFKPETICYTVYDDYGNSISGSEKIILQLQCFNGLEDPSEKGVDCGGPCSARCGTCDNGKQDAFEEGVDCGWVCESEKSCKKESSFERECESDLNCADGFICNYRGSCIKDNTADYDFYAEDESNTNILGIIFIILGILFMLGGAGYIYYSRSEKSKQIQTQNYNQNQEQRTRELSKSEQEIARRRAEDSKRRANLIQEKKEQEQELRTKRIDKRKESRRSILGAFSSDKTSSDAQSGDQSKKQKNLFDNNANGDKDNDRDENKDNLGDKNKDNDSDKSQETTNSADEESYLNISEINNNNNNNNKNNKNNKNSKNNGGENSIDKLSSLASTKISQKQKQTNQKNKKEVKKGFTANLKNSRKHSAFDDIDSLAKKSNLSSNPNEDYFTTLENTVKAAKGKSSDKIIESLAKNISSIQGKISPEDFVKKFSKSALTYHLDDKVLKKLINLLESEGKLDKSSAKSILEKLT